MRWPGTAQKRVLHRKVKVERIRIEIEIGRKKIVIVIGSGTGRRGATSEVALDPEIEVVGGSAVAREVEIEVEIETGTDGGEAGHVSGTVTVGGIVTDVGRVGVIVAEDARKSVIEIDPEVAIETRSKTMRRKFKKKKRC